MRNRTLLAILAIVLAAVLAYAIWPDRGGLESAKAIDTAPRNPLPNPKTQPTTPTPSSPSTSSTEPDQPDQAELPAKPTPPTKKSLVSLPPWPTEEEANAWWAARTEPLPDVAETLGLRIRPGVTAEEARKLGKRALGAGVLDAFAKAADGRDNRLMITAADSFRKVEVVSFEPLSRVAFAPPSTVAIVSYTASAPVAGVKLLLVVSYLVWSEGNLEQRIAYYRDENLNLIIEGNELVHTASFGSNALYHQLDLHSDGRVYAYEYFSRSVVVLEDTDSDGFVDSPRTAPFATTSTDENVAYYYRALAVRTDANGHLRVALFSEPVNLSLTRPQAYLVLTDTNGDFIADTAEQILPPEPPPYNPRMPKMVVPIREGDTHAFVYAPSGSKVWVREKEKRSFAIKYVPEGHRQVSGPNRSHG